MTLGLAGCVIGLLVGLSGTGGGSLLTPLLVLVFGLSPTAAISSDLIATAAMRFVGAVVHQVRRDVQFRLVLWLSVGGVPAALVGPVVTRLVGPVPALEQSLRFALGVVLLVVALINVGTLTRRPSAPTTPSQVKVRAGLLVPLGALTGLLVGFTSVGSGSITAAVLLLTHPRLRPSSLVATDVTQSLPMVVSAAVGQYLLGDFHPDVAWPLLVGGIPGVVVGALLAPRLPVRALRTVLVVLLASTGMATLTSDLTVVGLTAAAAAVLTAAAWRWAERHRQPESPMDQQRPSPPLGVSGPAGRQSDEPEP